MAGTARDVCEQALRSLGVVASGSDMTAEEFTHADAALRGMCAELVQEGLSGFGSPDRVSGWAFLPLAQMLAAEIAPQYEIPVPRNQWWWGMTRLRRHMSPDDRADAEIPSDGSATVYY